MGKRKINLEQFVGLLPFGYTSRKALYILSMPCEEAYIEYSDVIPMTKRVLICEKARAAACRHIKHLIQGGYIEELSRKYGNAHWEEFSMVRLTPAGFYVLTGTPCSKIESSRIEKCMQANMTYKAATSFFKGREKTEADRKFLMELASKHAGNIANDAYFDIKLEELVTRCDCTLLANQIHCVHSINLTSPGHNGARQFRNWRDTNINALFAANSFLTTIDRRPIPVGWQKELIQKKHDDSYYDTDELPVFVRRSLVSWFSTHPESFSFRMPWLTTTEGIPLGSGQSIPYHTIPAYYSATEIPGFGADMDEDYHLKTSGANNTLNHNFSGLAIGMTTNYLIYHARPVKTPWAEKTERTSAQAVQLWLDKINKTQPILGANRTINNAIIVCTTTMQFASIFKAVFKKLGNNPNRFKRIGEPFSCVSLVILENSGVQQIRHLMSSSPIAIETSMMYGLLENYPDKFSKTGNPLFQLSFNGKPVLIAYMMDLQKLYRAWREYEDGKRFYVLCYPEQVKYISKIMPDLDFL